MTEDTNFDHLTEVVIRFSTNTAAFHEGDSSPLEVAAILHKIAARFEEGLPSSAIPVRDSNGNLVGTVELSFG